MRKIIALGIMLLFLGMTISSSTGFNLEKQSTVGVITVDDEGDGDYTSIKEAVNNSNPGNIIEVYSGTYYEQNITIETEEITLKGIPYELGVGNGTGKPFIDGQGKTDVFRVMAEDVTISGFHIENEGNILCGTIVLINTFNCTISNNDISHTLMACVDIHESNNNMVINNNISNSIIRQGIVVRKSNNNNISGNVISDIASEGILVWGGNNNIIVGNIVKRCNEGICLIGNFNLVKQNVIEDNTYGVAVYDSSFNVIRQNNFGDNTKRDALFNLGIPVIPLPNFWFNNYWSRPRILPYPIFGGVLFFIPWVQFDWRPALSPHDIGV